ncbi:unnamed protein product, partial [Effrenium voratum]
MPAPDAWALHVELAQQGLEEVPAEGPALLEILPEPLALLRLSRGVPECVRQAARNGDVCTVVQEPGAATAWVPQKVLGDLARAKAEGADPRPGAWRALRATATVSAAKAARSGGVVAPLLALKGLAQVISVGAEVLLVPQAELAKAASRLLRAGHGLWPSSALISTSQENGTRDKD